MKKFKYKLAIKGKWAEIISKSEEGLPFKVGDRVTILSRPKSYSNYIGGDNGLDVVAYPYTFTVKGIRHRPSSSMWNGHIAIFDGTYGWSYYPELFKLVEEPIEIAGYTAKIKEGKISIGCYKDITLKDLKALRRAIKIANKYGCGFDVTERSIIENGEGNAIFLDEIEQLIERLDG